MQLYNAHNKNLGFTLIEMLVTAIIVAVIAAVATPNLLGLLNQNKVKEGLGTVEGALKEAQRQAKKLGRTCTVTFDNSTKLITAAPGGCLLRTRELDDDVDIVDSGGNSTFNLAFSHKGTYANIGTTIIVSGDYTSNQKCLAITTGTGIMRTGDYNADNSPACTTVE